MHTVLRDQWIIRGAEIDEPVPVRTFSQQNRGGVERVRDHGGTPIGNEVGLSDHLHIPEPRENRVLRNEPLQIGSLLDRGLEVEVDHVAIPRVVES